MTQTEPRNFQEELNAMLQPLKSEDFDLFAGTTVLKDFQSMLDAVEQRVIGRNIFDFRIDLMIDVLGLQNEDAKGTDMLKFSQLINELPRMSANDLGMSLAEFIVFQNDVSVIITNYNATIAPQKAIVDKEAEEYHAEVKRKAELQHAKMNPTGARK